MSDNPVVSRPGAMPAGLEEPPRIFPPNPQHPEIPQTYDPRVSVQLERAARDRASGQPGSAARQDAEQSTIDPKAGAGPQPRRLSAAQRNSAQSVDGIPPRETVVTFNQQFASYFPGETAAFTDDEAQQLSDLGVTDGGDGGGPPATEAPVNVDVPVVTQEDVLLNCTMGNWSGEPTSYAYQWQIDGADAGTGESTYVTTADDVGKTATCVVTATNAAGSTAAPPSVGVIVTGDAGTSRSTRTKK
jgi:hypothetical protein